jgi:hypothetical protein
MRWKTDKGLKHGDTRKTKCFALFPTALGDGYTVWFETYCAEEQWYVGWDDQFGTNWRTMRTWCEKKARPNET